MKDTIVQEVCEARAAVAADFDCDLGKFFAWARTHTASERKAKHPLTAQHGSYPVATAPARKTIRERFRVKFLNLFKPAQTKTPSGPSAAAFSSRANRRFPSGGYFRTRSFRHLKVIAKRQAANKA